MKFQMKTKTVAHPILPFNTPKLQHKTTPQKNRCECCKILDSSVLKSKQSSKIKKITVECKNYSRMEKTSTDILTNQKSITVLSPREFRPSRIQGCKNLQLKSIKTNYFRWIVPSWGLQGCSIIQLKYIKKIFLSTIIPRGLFHYDEGLQRCKNLQLKPIQIISPQVDFPFEHLFQPFGRITRV